MSGTTIWHVLKRHLHMKPYRLLLVQVLKRADKVKRVEFCDAMLEMENDDNTISQISFSGEATFYTNSHVNRHNVRIWGTEHPHETVQHKRDSPKVNVFCAVNNARVNGPFFFQTDTVTGERYLEML
ncbi:hypothetical protein C0J52_20246 [Blattella germanica]|nr:hypothetical protein C0J52_20246 [Blattella germanica]